MATRVNHEVRDAPWRWAARHRGSHDEMACGQPCLARHCVGTVLGSILVPLSFNEATAGSGGRMRTWRAQYSSLCVARVYSLAVRLLINDFDEGRMDRSGVRRACSRNRGLSFLPLAYFQRVCASVAPARVVAHTSKILGEHTCVCSVCFAHFRLETSRHPTRLPIRQNVHTVDRIASKCLSGFRSLSLFRS
jgi:hypothetical protein